MDYPGKGKRCSQYQRHSKAPVCQRVPRQAAMASIQAVRTSASAGQIRSPGVSRFQEYLLKNRINHILGRVNHPQTNGKIERFYETFQSKVHHFESVEQFVDWYNTKKPHMSLNWEELETPIQAFYRKVDGRRKLPFMVSNLR